jgi:hypothetical protein
MQVEYEKTFCALIEQGLAKARSDREIICENYGIAATGLFEYWHRIRHDVMSAQPPDALVLCIYPGNDFSGDFPADGFDSDGHPRSVYYTNATWFRHVLTWLNLNSQLARYVQERMHRAWKRLEPSDGAPQLWWIDPAVAAGASQSPVVSRCRALLRAIDDLCRQCGTKLCVLVVGPVTTYPPYHGQSPLRAILANWKIEAPVVDVAVQALQLPHFENLLFPRDGHLNDLGHAYVAQAALTPLQAALFPPAISAFSQVPIKSQLR